MIQLLPVNVTDHPVRLHKLLGGTIEGLKKCQRPVALFLGQMLKHSADAQSAVGHKDNLLGAQKVLEDLVGVVDERQASLVVEDVRVGLCKTSQLQAQVQNRVVGTAKGCMVEVLLLFLVVKGDQCSNVQIVRDLLMNGLVQIIGKNGLHIGDVPEGAKALGIRTNSRTESRSPISRTSWRD